MEENQKIKELNGFKIDVSDGLIRVLRDDSDKEFPCIIQLVKKDSKWDEIYEERLSPNELTNFIEILGKIKKNRG